MQRVLIKELDDKIGENVNIKGWIHRIRKLKSITFIVIRDRTGLVQCVVENHLLIPQLSVETVVSIEGLIEKSENKLNPYEVQIHTIQLLNSSLETPIEVNNVKLEASLDTILNHRMLSLRHPSVNSIFKIQNILVNEIRKFLNQNEFMEIFTPKIVSEGAEGGSAVFKLNYFEKQAYLAQSPQFYKQMMVGAGFEKVFEIAHAYRAEEHNTSRHLNEYISVDLEIGFIKDEYDLMKIEEELLKYLLKEVKSQGEKYLKILDVELPDILGEIPKMEFQKVLHILKTQFNRTDLNGDLDPEAEKQIYAYCRDQFQSDFLFVTNYPKQKRPMYTMPFGESGTRSFDLLFKGVEITTGGQRIHDYAMLLSSMKARGLDPESYVSYLDAFK
ncbi:MAG: aspartate--tRNA(Asn) ligase, partial [Streptococcaceae bacterium]|nr:aspartate--tRNA(Asn) ligase [Streptococcaceae bacterium]